MGKAALKRLNDAHATVYDVILNFPFYNDHIEQVMAELKPEGGRLYLDLGCGTGSLLNMAERMGFSFIGVDFSPEMLKRAKGKGKGLILADLHHLPLKDSCINGVTSVNVFYQLDDPETFVGEVHRVLKPGGKIVISTPRRGKSSLRFIPELLKAILKNPRILASLTKVLKYNWINWRILRLNPDAFYEEEELSEMLRGFKIEGIRKAYVGQNWLISARKPARGNLESIRGRFRERQTASL